jgi:hypothetical protein
MLVIMSWFSFLYLLKILHQLLNAIEVVELGAVLSDFIGVVVHITHSIKNVDQVP